MPYIGGKSRIARWLIHPLIPKNIHTFISFFGGMFWEYFTLDLSLFPNLKNVVYVDQNPLNVNLMLSLKRYNDFHDYLKEHMPLVSDRDTFKAYQAEIYSSDFLVNLDSTTPDFATAFKLIYVMNCVFNGNNPLKASFCPDSPTRSNKFKTLMKKLKNKKWQEHIDKITLIIQGDYKDVVAEYDKEGVFGFYDPPYLNREHFYALHSFNRSSHHELGLIINNVKNAYTALSYYYFDDLQTMYPTTLFNWYSREFYRPSAHGKGKGREYLITNF